MRSPPYPQVRPVTKQEALHHHLTNGARRGIAAFMSSASRLSTPSVLIAPSILSADFAKLGEEIAAVEQAGAHWIHVDVMDGHFVPNITIGAPVVKSLRKTTKLPLDVHLMISNPDAYVEAFATAGADIITVHAEACTHLHRTLQLIRSFGKKAGVSLNPHTSESVLAYVPDLVDLVLVMSVNPGFGGQAFIPAVLPKITRVREWMRSTGREADIHLEVDGGIAEGTAKQAVAAGADVLVAGNAIFGVPSGSTAGVASYSANLQRVLASAMSGRGKDA